MKHTSIRKPLSVLLSILMVLSVFGGMAFPAGAESKTIAQGVIYKLGDTIVLPGNGIYYVKDSERHPAQEIYSNGTITEFEGDEYAYSLMIDEWGIYARIDMFDYQEEINQGLSVLGITFTGSGTQSDPYLPKLAFGVFESTWAGEGEGTEDSPWLIKDLNDLRTLSANVASGMMYTGKYLKLAADIDCGSENWAPIGTFGGTFDGNGKTVSYQINGSEAEKNGLFAEISNVGTVKNLNVSGSIVSSADFNGGVAGKNCGSIINCFSTVDITTSSMMNGGIAGGSWFEDAKISYCAASGTLTWTGASDRYSNTGGITGENRWGVIDHCTSFCNVLAENAKDSWAYVGILDGRDMGTTTDCYYLDTATTAGLVNFDGAEKKTVDELKVIGQAAFDAGYTVYGLALGAVAPNPDQEAADAVIALIDAIGEVALTDECKDKIDAAKAAYEALTDAQKASVTNYETLQLAEGQYAALQLAADMTAFEAYKTAKKSAMDALLQEGDSEAVQNIVGLAKTQIEGFTYDESKTLDENKAALDTLVANVPNAVAEQRAADAQLAADKAAFDDYKAEQKAAVEAMAEEGDSTDAQQIIAAAAAAIDALTYDEAKTLDENKAAADEIADIADALTAQRAADALAEAKEQLANAIEEAKAYYNEIKDDERYAEIANALKTAYERGESALASDDAEEILAFAANVSFALETAQAEKATVDKAAADKAAADEVAALIDAIGEVAYTDESKAKIDAAKAAYDALTDAQKALVDNADVLTAAEESYAELKAAGDDAPCPVCGKVHGNSLYEQFMSIIHTIIILIKWIAGGFKGLY